MKSSLIYLLRLINIPATKDNLTWSHVYAFLQSHFRRIFGVSDWRKEVIVWRKNFLETHPIGKHCLQSGKCPCQCDTEDVILSDDACDKNCFPAMTTKEDWELFKAQKRIFVDIHNNRVIYYT